MHEATLSTTVETNGQDGAAGPEPQPYTRATLNLVVTDPDVCAELRARGDDDAGHRYALAVLRIGKHAIRQASGVIDAATVGEVTFTLGHCGMQLFAKPLLGSCRQRG